MKKMKRWICLALSLSLLMVGLPGSMSVQAEEIGETEDVVYVTFDFNYPGTPPFVLPVKKGERIGDAMCEFQHKQGIDLYELLRGMYISADFVWNPDPELESYFEWESLVPEADITLYAKTDSHLSEEVFYNLTIDYDGHGENVVIPFIPEGAHLNGLCSCPQIWDGIFYDEGDYFVYPFCSEYQLGPKPISAYDSWEDWNKYEQNYLDWEGHYSNVHEDTTLYVQWMRSCSPTEVTYSLPSEGDTVHIPDYPDGEWNWEQQTNRPVLVLPKDVEGVNFTCEEGLIGNWVQVDDSDLPKKYETVDEDKFATPFEGTMKKGESYYASFIYETKVGYTYGIPELLGLPENVEVVANNEYEPILDEYGYVMIPRWITVLKVTPEEEPDVADVDHELMITKQPNNVTVATGNMATFSVFATGTELKYQWQYSTDNGKTWKNNTVSGCNTSSMSIEATAKRNGYLYHCIVTDGNGTSVTSDAAKLTVTVAPKITTQPKDVTAEAGKMATFSVGASGTGLKYQWQYSTDNGKIWKNNTVSGCNTSSMSIEATAKRNGYLYHCIVTDGNGTSVTSNAAKLTVTAAPKITTQPKDVTVEAGKMATFSVGANGTGLKYQWQYSTNNGMTWKNNTVSGCNTSSMSIEATAKRNGYLYHCIVTDGNGKTVTSNAAKLTVK